MCKYSIQWNHATFQKIIMEAWSIDQWQSICLAYAKPCVPYPVPSFTYKTTNTNKRKLTKCKEFLPIENAKILLKNKQGVKLFGYLVSYI